MAELRSIQNEEVALEFFKETEEAHMFLKDKGGWCRLWKKSRNWVKY